MLGAEPAPARVDTTAADAEAAVRRWAQAWTRRDLPAYFAAYAPDFTGPQASRSDWEQQRRERIASRKRINVELEELKVNVEGDRAVVMFRQSYASDALAVSSRKSLELSRDGSGQWLIRRETVRS
jgi:ketosteroid isomerase-like protein